LSYITAGKVLSIYNYYSQGFVMVVTDLTDP